MKKRRFDPTRLTDARVQKGWNYTDLSLELFKKGMRVAYNTISNWESGKTCPRVNQLLVVAEALGVPMEYFFAYKVQESTLPYHVFAK